jgi:hypothetical protein
MALKSRVLQKLGRVEETHDVEFESLLRHYTALRDFAQAQHKEMRGYLEKSRRATPPPPPPSRPRPPSHTDPGSAHEGAGG